MPPHKSPAEQPSAVPGVVELLDSLWVQPLQQPPVCGAASASRCMKPELPGRGSHTAEPSPAPHVVELLDSLWMQTLPGQKVTTALPRSLILAVHRQYPAQRIQALAKILQRLW